jgi:hypothetical protein
MEFSRCGGSLLRLGYFGDGAAEGSGAGLGEGHAPEFLGAFGEFERAMELAFGGAADAYDFGFGLFVVVFVDYVKLVADAQGGFEDDDSAVGAYADRFCPVAEFRSCRVLAVHDEIHAHGGASRPAALYASKM